MSTGDVEELRKRRCSARKRCARSRALGHRAAPKRAALVLVSSAAKDELRRGDTEMAELTGNEILARCLKAQGVKDMFFIMGGPMLDAELSLHQGRHPPDRHAPRAGRGLYGAGLFAGDAGAGRVHGGERPGDLEFRHRPRQCADRLLPGRRARRVEPDQPVRPPGVPGDRPGQGARRPASNTPTACTI